MTYAHSIVLDDYGRAKGAASGQRIQHCISWGSNDLPEETILDQLIDQL